SPVPLKDNLLAQKLRFKLALLLGIEDVVRATYRHLSLQQMLDPEAKRLGDLLEVSGLDKARERLVKDLAERGVDLVLPSEPPRTGGVGSGPRSSPPKGESGTEPVEPDLTGTPLARSELLEAD